MVKQECEKRFDHCQHTCDRCGYVWDLDDDDPPQCKSRSEIAKEKIDKIKREVLQC